MYFVCNQNIEKFKVLTALNVFPPIPLSSVHMPHTGAPLQSQSLLYLYNYLSDIFHSKQFTYLIYIEFDLGQAVKALHICILIALLQHIHIDT